MNSSAYVLPVRRMMRLKQQESQRAAPVREVQSTEEREIDA